MLERRPADDAGVIWRSEDDQQRDPQPIGAAENADDDDRDQKRRDRVHYVDPAHDQAVGPAAAVSGEKPEHVADDKGAEDDNDRPDDRRPGADDKARQEVPSEVVSAERMAGS